MLVSTVTSVPIAYNTDNHNISFNLLFGEGKDSAIAKNETQRKHFLDAYDIEVYESGIGDEYMKGYRVITNEGPIVIRIDNICMSLNNSNEYEYAIGFALDNDEPEYNDNSNTIPLNIERDGTLWTIPANTGKYYNFDQNPNGIYQWVTKKALEKDYKPTSEEVSLGMEETSENTGLIYLTFMVFHKKKIIAPQVVSRGSGGATRGSGGATRGSSSQNVPESSAARFGYGNESQSASVKSEFKFVEGTEKYILPIRLRISEKSLESNINCSKTLSGANINTLRKQTMKMPF